MGANAAATLRSGVGAASLAAASGNTAALKAALAAGAPTAVRPDGGMTALHIAASHPATADHTQKLVRALLEAGADPNGACALTLSAHCSMLTAHRLTV
jgi:ankyrin repeat protein